ncbi:hypothetical protein JCM11641_002001 [Rhodosporidiobolus odoratus]
MTTPLASLAFPSTDEQPVKPKRKPYTTQSSRSFSRSALQRQSVHALPSIKHLQHGFARLALSAPTQPRSIAEMVRGPMSLEDKREARRRTSGIRQPFREDDEDGLQEEEDLGLGPAPQAPEVDSRMPWEKEGEEKVKTESELRDEVLQGLEGVCERWGLLTQLTSLSMPSHLSRRLSRSADASTSSPDASRAASPSLFLASPATSLAVEEPLSPFSDSAESSTTAASGSSKEEMPLVLDLLSTTTGAIRSVQRYVVSLPSSTFSTASASPSPLRPTDASNRDLPHLRVSTAARPRTSLALPFSSPSLPTEAGKGKARVEDEEPDCLKELRKQSLEVLAVLREIEGQFRLASPSPSSSLTPTPGDQPPKIPAEHSPSITFSQVLEAVPAAQKTVTEWVEAVNQIVASAGTRRKGRGRTSEISEVGGGEEGEERDAVPEWAREEFESGSLARAHALFLAHSQHFDLPASFPSSPPTVSTASHLALLSHLVSGTLLCHAYNAVLRHSSNRPFGFIPAGSVHDIEETSEKGGKEMQRGDSADSEKSEELGGGRGVTSAKKVGRTFRRVENLRVWAAALKFRYFLPLLFPSPSTSAATSTVTLSSGAVASPYPAQASEHALLFDPLLVAREAEGWEGMLEKVIGGWAEAVGREVREQGDV